VQELLGHSDATMTLYYTHFSAQAKKDAITAYDDALEKGDWRRLAKINEEHPVSE
jgi:integrase